MGTGKCSKHKISGIRSTLINSHSGKTLIFFTDCCDIGKIKFRIYTMTYHVHCKCHDIHVSGTLSISKQSTFHTVSSG